MAINDPANRLANKINDIVDSKIKKRTKKASLIKSGTVVRIDSDGMPWVSVSGADGETPVNGKVLANVKPGDAVSVSIENGKCNILGNPDDPSIGSNEAKNVSNREIKIAVEQEGTIGRAIDVESNKTINKVDGMISDQLVPIEESIDDLDLKSGEDIRILRNRVSSSISTIETVRGMAGVANIVAEEAKDVAEAVNQHFWEDDNGVHVTEVTQDEWKDSESQTYNSGHNILINSFGILLRKALNYIGSWTGSAISFFDGEGNLESNVTASFGSNGAQIGKIDDLHIEIDTDSVDIIDGQDSLASFGETVRLGKGYVWGSPDNEDHIEINGNSFSMFDKSGDSYIKFCSLTNAAGVTSVTEAFIGNGFYNVFTLRHEAIDANYTVEPPEGYTVLSKTKWEFTLNRVPQENVVFTASYETSSVEFSKAFTLGERMTGPIGLYSYSEGYANIAAGEKSHAEGSSNKVYGNYSHVEGTSNTIYGSYSHAEGVGNTTSYRQSCHVEGTGCASTGGNSHAEGYHSTASGSVSHSEGMETTASGDYSHSQNQRTVAAGNSQTAIGKYNEQDSTSALIIGNGTDSNNRSNALTVDWSGNVEAAGDVIANGVVETNTIKYPNVEVKAPASDLLIDIYDSSTGDPKYKWYMSNYGNFARQQYSNGAWGTAQYYLVRDDIHSLFSCSSISYTIGSVAAGSTKTLTFSAAKTDYDPIAISGWYMNGAAGLYPYMLRLNGSEIQCFVRNPTSSASSSTAKVEVQVLYCRSGW